MKHRRRSRRVRRNPPLEAGSFVAGIAVGAGAVGALWLLKALQTPAAASNGLPTGPQPPVLQPWQMAGLGGLGATGISGPSTAGPRGYVTPTDTRPVPVSLTAPAGFRVVVLSGAALNHVLADVVGQWSGTLPPGDYSVSVTDPNATNLGFGTGAYFPFTVAPGAPYAETFTAQDVGLQLQHQSMID